MSPGPFYFPSLETSKVVNASLFKVGPPGIVPAIPERATCKTIHKTGPIVLSYMIPCFPAPYLPSLLFNSS